ncbi:MAG TPA: DUF2794 domain-containing protein [Allosphingosinicella sp.]|jgi:hypothetical protein|nr:DUF2794 domain-containing protein [Allosphingosinicella sp.]
MGAVLPFPSRATGGQTGFTRFELHRIVDLYGRMVAAGLWKDYAIAFEPGAAAFWAFRRTAEHPECRIEKRPGARQGAWTLIGEGGQVLRRGPELGPILAPLERRLLKLVAG